MKTTPDNGPINYALSVENPCLLAQSNARSVRLNPSYRIMSTMR